MSLDVVAFSFIRPIIQPINIDWESVDLECEYGLIQNKYFQIELAYPGEKKRLNPLSEGEYQLTDKSEKYWFRAGSYSTHSKWHQTFLNLAEIFWQNGLGEIKPNEPFYFQFEFPSQEGVFGTQACQKMLQDYEKYEEYLSLKWEKLSYPDKFARLYYSFKEGFRIGSQEGVIFLC